VTLTEMQRPMIHMQNLQKALQFLAQNFSEFSFLQMVPANSSAKLLPIFLSNEMRSILAKYKFHLYKKI